MRTFRYTYFILFITCFALTGCQKTFQGTINDIESWWHSGRSKVVERVEHDFKFRTLSLGSPVFIRIFKSPAQLELWIQEDGSERYGLYKTYPICNYSGALGPKLKEGDKQSPEGFYRVAPEFMNPNSKYHLSFNIGFPNKYDQSLGRTGSLIMVHGGCESIGCYAMTDPVIEEIYAIVEMAHKGGQSSVPIHIFPFPMTTEKMEEYKNVHWYGFWDNLRTGYDYFEMTKQPPRIFYQNGRYIFRS